MMTRRAFVSRAKLVPGVLMVMLASVSIEGQVPSIPVKTPEGWTPPRTPWGDPDIQGNLTNLYELGTSFERPAQFEGRRIEDITAEELQAVRKAAQERAVNNRLNAEGVQGGTPEIWLDAYRHERGSMPWLVVDPPDGRIPPLVAGAQARGRGGRRGSGADAGRPSGSIEDRSLYDRCISRGLPDSMMPTLYGNSYQIVQSPGYVAIRYEMIHETRIIPLDGRPHLNTDLTLWMGDGRGHWEGDTLVVETTNFRPDMTPRGANPATLKLTERFRRVAPDKIHWYVTFDDPETWTRPWTYMIPLTIDDEQAIVEYACHEANYAMWNIIRGQRTEERSQ
jgi:hypothetical protein